MQNNNLEIEKKKKIAFTKVFIFHIPHHLSEKYENRRSAHTSICVCQTPSHLNDTPKHKHIYYFKEKGI